jgi:hypothetical protein
MPACGSPTFNPERSWFPPHRRPEPTLAGGRAGHLPQIEQPDATFGALDAFIRKNPDRPAA